MIVQAGQLEPCGGEYLESASGNSSKHLNCQYNGNGSYGLHLEKGSGVGPHYSFSLDTPDIESNGGVGLFLKEIDGISIESPYLEFNAGDIFVPSSGGVRGLVIDGGTPYGLSQLNDVDALSIVGTAFQSYLADANGGLGLQLVGCTRIGAITPTFPNGGFMLTDNPIKHEFAPVWASYTPAWLCNSGGNPSIGNGSISGRFRRVGNTVTAKILLTFGSTTNVGAGDFWVFGVPFTSRGGAFSGFGTVKDTRLGVSRYTLKPEIFPNSTGAILADQAGGGLVTPGSLSWASGDMIQIVIDYECASDANS